MPLGVKAVDERGRRGRARVGDRRRRSTPRSRALAAFGGVARRFEYRGERDGVTFVDDYAHLPGEVAAAIATARQGAWRRVIAVFQPHRYSRTASLWPTSPARSTGRRGRAHRRVPRGGDTDPGRVGPRVVHAVLDRHPRCRSRTSRAAPICRRAAALRPPRRRRADPRRRRPHDPARRLARAASTRRERPSADRTRRARSRRVLAVPARRAGGARRALGAAHDVSLRRPAGGARPRRAGGRPRRARRGARGARRIPCSCRPGIEPARRRRRASTGSRSCSAASSSASTSTRPAREVEAGGAVALPVLARAGREAGIGGLEFFVGIPGSVGGAVRMNAGGHGAQTADVVLSPGSSTSATASPANRTPGQLGLGYRTSALGRAIVVVAARFAGRADDPTACARAHRRDRPLAARAPARRAERGIGVHEPARRLGRPAHRGVRAARACASGARWCRRSTPTSSSPIPARAPPTCSSSWGSCSRRVEAATGVRLEPELHLVGFAQGSEEARG